MVSWSIDENKGYELTGETVFGLTSTNSQGRSVISYVGFTSDLKKIEQELNDAVGITSLPINRDEVQTIYALDGTQRTKPLRGVNIISKGGKTSKFYKP